MPENGMERLADKLRSNHPETEQVWYSQGFIGVKLVNDRNARYIKVPRMPEGLLPSYLDGEITELSRRFTV